MHLTQQHLVLHVDVSADICMRAGAASQSRPRAAAPVAWRNDSAGVDKWCTPANAGVLFQSAEESGTVLHHAWACRMEPGHREEYVAYLKVKEQWGQAAEELAKLVNDDSFRSIEGKSKHHLWLELCDIITKHPDDVRSLDIDAIIRAGIRKFPTEVWRRQPPHSTQIECCMVLHHRLIDRLVTNARAMRTSAHVAVRCPFVRAGVCARPCQRGTVLILQVLLRPTSGRASLSWRMRLPGGRLCKLKCSDNIFDFVALHAPCRLVACGAR